MIFFDNNFNCYILQINNNKYVLRNRINRISDLELKYQKDVLALGEGQLILSKKDPIINKYLTIGISLLLKK